MVRGGTSAIDIPCQDCGDLDGSFVGSPTSYVNIPHVPQAEDIRTIMRRDSEVGIGSCLLILFPFFRACWKGIYVLW